MEFGSDLLLLTSEQSVFYLTGFYTEARRPKQIGPCAVLANGEAVTLIAPDNWRIQAERALAGRDAALICYSGGERGFSCCICKLLTATQKTEVGIERGSIGLPLYSALKDACSSFSFFDVSATMERKRMRKTPGELNCLRRAAELAVLGMERAREVLCAGISEREVVAELEYAMRRAGSEGVPFSVKVLAGEKSAHTTFMPDETVIRRGDLVLLDFGARWGNYASDWTRTFCIGPASPEQRALYDAVRNVERSCIAMMAPGVSLLQLMEHARSLLAGSRYEPYFLPHLGHSVGINSHEWPVIEPQVDSALVLEENMVFTIEPGIYLPGFGGVRIEDEVLITSDGYEILTGLREEGLELI